MAAIAVDINLPKSIISEEQPKQMAELNNQAKLYKNNLADIEKQLGRNCAEYKKAKPTSMIFGTITSHSTGKM